MICDSDCDLRLERQAVPPHPGPLPGRGSVADSVAASGRAGAGCRRAADGDVRAGADLLGEQRGEHAEEDVENRQQAGGEGRGVAQGDHDDVRGQPEVGVQHGAQHLHRIAAQGEVMGDHQRDEAGQRGDDAADADPVDPLQDQPQHHRPPADEDGRGVEVGHRRAAFQHHAEDQAEGVDQPGQDDQVKRRAAQRFRQIGRDREGQQRAARQDERAEVDDHRVEEGLDVVEVELGPALPELLLELRREPLPVSGHGAVEAVGLVLAVGGGHRGKVRHGGMERGRVAGFEQAGAHGLPVVARLAPGRAAAR